MWGTALASPSNTKEPVALGRSSRLEAIASRLEAMFYDQKARSYDRKRPPPPLDGPKKPPVGALVRSSPGTSARDAGVVGAPRKSWHRRGRCLRNRPKEAEREQLIGKILVKDLRSALDINQIALLCVFLASKGPHLQLIPSNRTSVRSFPFWCLCAGTNRPGSGGWVGCSLG